MTARANPSAIPNFRPIILRRKGVPPFTRGQIDREWRDWALAEAQACGVRDVPHAFVAFQPYKGGGPPVRPGSYWRTADAVLAGLVGGGLLYSQGAAWLDGILLLSAIYDPGFTGLEVRISSNA
jgi:hypothetical protein